MVQLGKYCKAYPLKKLRQFSQWTERLENVRKDKQEADSQEVEVPKDITDDDFLYLQDNYVVTDGIFLDKNIVFDNVTPEWKEFCTQMLGYVIPIYQPVTANADSSSRAE